MSNHVLFEIGTEELPARFIDDAERQLLTKTTAWLNDSNITFDNIRSYSTPRRLAIIIENISEYQNTITEEVRGPQLKVAKDEEGNWTKAAVGFTKGQEKQLEDIYTKEVKGTSYVFVEKKIVGQKTSEILPAFKDIISAIHFPQTMRWGTGTFRFARPIRWIVALLNKEIIPFEVANVESSNITFGHRFLGEKSIINDPLQYESVLEENYVIVNPAKREEQIIKQIKELERAEGFHIEVSDKLLNEVRNLVEYPTAFHGTFEKEYLKLPEETLITSMAEHQRYFPVKDQAEGKLLPYFVSVRNGDRVELDNVVRGNEKVLRARLSDGAFFYEEDKSHSVDFYINKLKTVVFQEKIGTVFEKLTKIQLIVKQLSKDLDLESKIKSQAIRTAQICKFDLVTDMVNEFPELQGIMGEKYALHYGEEEEVAQAIREHYLPVQANGTLPQSVVGSVVSVADKLDTIIGSISVGLVPTGSQDPYGLRRQAIGVLKILLEEKWDLSVESLINNVSELYEIEDAEVQQEINRFFKSRAAYILSEHSIEQDIIQAILHEGIGSFHYKIDKAILLSNKRNEASFKEIEEALVRVMNLGKKHEQTIIDESLFQTDSEKELYTTFKNVQEQFSKYNNQFEAENALTELTELARPIETFFDNNMVMAEDIKVQNNRLALVHLISNLIMQFADLTLIEWKQHQ